MRIAFSILAATAALAVAGCGGSGGGSTSSSGQTQFSASSTGNSPSSSNATTVVTSTVTSTTSSAAPLCVASSLRATYLGQQGATGHGELGFALRNISGRSCHTFGFPGVLFLARSGSALATSSTRTTHDFFGVVPVRSLTVAPGATVSFRLGVTHGVTSTAQCATAYTLQVIPPNDTHTIVARIPGGAYECRTATVSPLQPGRSAYP